MRRGSISENKILENRIAITPETAKKYISLGFDVFLTKDYGTHLGFEDNEYKKINVKIFDNEIDLIKNSDLLLQLNLFSDDKISSLKENQTLIGIFNSYSNKDNIDLLNK